MTGRILAMYQEYKRTDFPQVPDISAEEARKWVTGNRVLVLDVRGTKERAVSTLPGAIDPGTWGVRAYNLAGGILAWVQAGGPVVDGRTGTPTRRVHVYGRKWNLLQPGWEGIW